MLQVARMADDKWTHFSWENLEVKHCSDKVQADSASYFNPKGTNVIYIYIYDISSLRVNDLTLIILTWRKW